LNIVVLEEPIIEKVSRIVLNGLFTFPVVAVTYLTLFVDIDYSVLLFLTSTQLYLFSILNRCKYFNKKQANQIKKRAGFYLNQLKVPNSLEVTIILGGNLDRKYGIGTLGATGLIDNNKVVVEIVPNFNFGFRIFNDRDTLAHELVHVDQQVKNRLITTNDKTTWDGKDYTGVKYKDAPWEIDARGREKILYKMYKERL
jgi:hypothetical protein